MLDGIYVLNSLSPPSVWFYDPPQDEFSQIGQLGCSAPLGAVAVPITGLRGLFLIDAGLVLLAKAIVLPALLVVLIRRTREPRLVTPAAPAMVRLAGAGAIEQQAQRGDIAIGADLLLLDDDRADQSVQRRIRQGRRLADGPLVHLGPQRLETFALGDSPARVAGAGRVLAADIDFDATDFQCPLTVDGQDPALAALHLRGERPANSGESEQDGGQENSGPAEQHQRAFGDNGVEIQARYGPTLVVSGLA